MKAKVFASPQALLDATGTPLGPTAWLTVTQEMIDLFARATGDHQWIHVDVERAKTGPFGGTIAHGYLTMSLVNHFLPEMIDVQRVAMGVNVGADRVRFLTPVPAGARNSSRSSRSRARCRRRSASGSNSKVRTGPRARSTRSAVISPKPTKWRHQGAGILSTFAALPARNLGHTSSLKGTSCSSLKMRSSDSPAAK